MKTVCCNPFGVAHRRGKSRIIYADLRKVTSELAASARLIKTHLVRNTMICSKCRKILHEKTNTKAKRRQQRQDENEPANQDDIENPVMEVGDPSELGFDKPEFIRRLNELLPQIGVPEIDPKKIDKSISYCQTKMKEISSKLASEIFGITVSADTSYDVEAEDAEREMVQ